jgi:hypothetical protein
MSAEDLSKHQEWQAFLVNRAANVVASQVHKSKGRELNINKLPPEIRQKFLEGSRVKEWASWLKYGTIHFLSKEEQSMVPEDRIMRLRFVDTDKNQGIRDELSYEELECIPKSRLVVPGFGDPDALAGKLRTDAPTLTPERCNPHWAAGSQ